MVDDTFEERGGRRYPDAALAAIQAEADRVLEAIHRLEDTLASATAGPSWGVTVAANLRALQAAIRAELSEIDRPDALTAMIAAENSRRFGTRVSHLRDQLEDIVRQTSLLSAQVDRSEPDAMDADDIRQRSAWLIRSIHRYRGRQADLVYEALELDLGRR